MAGGNKHDSWGRMPWCASVPGLVCEGLDTEPAWEQARRLFLTHAASRHLCEGWRRVFPQISPYQFCYFFHIL
jgi:hypothetical protein